MSIIDRITANLNEDVVYWAVSSNDGYGGYNFSAGVNISGRWEEKAEKVVSANGEEVLTKVKCVVSQSVEEGGYLWKGTITDSGYTADPKDATGAYRILAVKKIPRLKHNDDFIIVAYCNQAS